VPNLARKVDDDPDALILPEEEERPEAETPPPEVDAVTGATPQDSTPYTPPAVPGGALTPEQEARAATTPNPSDDAVDKALTEAGQQPQAIQQQEQKGIEEQDKLLEQQIEAKKRADAAQAKIDQATAAQAEEQARIQQAHAQQQQQISDQANARTQQWMQRQQEEMDKYQSMGLHDFIGEMPLLNKVLAGLSMFTGAAGGTPPDRNPGVIAIRDAVNRDFQRQQFAISKQKEMVGMAKEGVETSLSMKQQDLADNNMKKAAALDAIAAQGVAMKLRNGVPLNEANSDAAIVALRQDANKTRMETLKLVHAQNVQEAMFAHKLGYDEQMLKLNKQRADAATLSAQARVKHLKAGGQGGGGGGGKAWDAMQGAAEATGANLASVVRAGLDNGMSRKEAAKQGKIIWDEYQKGGGAKKKADAAEIKEVAGEFQKDEARLNGSGRTQGLVARQQDIRGLGDMIRAASASGDPKQLVGAVVAAREKIARLNTGAAPSHEQMQLLKDMSGNPAQFEEKISRLFGNPKTAKQSADVLLSLIDQSDEHAMKQIDTERERLKVKYGPNGIGRTEAQRRYANGRIAGLTSGVKVRTDTGEIPRYNEVAPPPPEAGNDKAAKAQAIVSDPANKKKYGYNDQQWARLQQIADGK